MRQAQVHNVKLGFPPEGMKTIVWADGLKERSMLIDAKDGWDVSVIINDEETPKRTYCVESSPGFEKIRVTRMTQRELPKKLEISGKDVSPSGDNLTPEEIVRHTIGMYE